ncbi:hypothetical protein ACQPYH_21980 [Kribbella sp. CA-245084]|uniref:hypothetical protein n=1 Tax=Kribbella sp. CA-245084 TaxID=3239940 RepID=UPI003D91ABC0
MWVVRSSAALALFALAGCAALPRPDTVDALTRPAISAEAAAAVVRHYNSVSANANARRSDELMAGVQTGDLLRQTEAAYKISRLLKKPVTATPAFTAGSVGAPEYGSYPMHFVALGNHRLGVWERPSAGEAWRLMYALSVAVPEPTGLHDIAPTDGAGLVESPSVAAAKFAELLTVGAKSPYARLFTAAPKVAKFQKNLAASHAMAGHDHILAVTDTFSLNAPPTAFRTSSGEVLAFFTLTNAKEMRPQFGAMWPVGQDTAAFSTPNHLYRTALTTTTLHQFAIAIPAAKGGKIRVLGFTTQLVDSGGY